MRLRILVIEDNPDDTATWARLVERHNAGEPQTPVALTTTASLEAANEALDNGIFDVAIVDLRLDGNGKDPANNSGNQILARILESRVTLVAILTGQPTDADVPEFARQQVRVITKGGGEGEGTSAAFEWALGQAKLVNNLRKASALISKELAGVFHRSVWPRWKFWAESGSHDNFRDLALARHMTSHVHESLSEMLGQRAHPEEWFLLPPNADSIGTGDLVRMPDGTIEIAITPRCDFATNKNETVQLALCNDVSAKWNHAKSEIERLTRELQALAGEAREIKQKELGKAKGVIAEMIKHNGGRSAYHFLPRMQFSDGSSIGPLLVRFDRIRSIGKTEADPALQPTSRFASVSPVFLPSLVERLGSFFSRIGTPDYSSPD